MLLQWIFIKRNAGGVSAFLRCSEWRKQVTVRWRLRHSTTGPTGRGATRWHVSDETHPTGVCIKTDPELSSRHEVLSRHPPCFPSCLWPLYFWEHTSSSHGLSSKEPNAKEMPRCRGRPSLSQVRPESSAVCIKQTAGDTASKMKCGKCVYKQLRGCRVCSVQRISFNRFLYFLLEAIRMLVFDYDNDGEQRCITRFIKSAAKEKKPLNVCFL